MQRCRGSSLAIRRSIENHSGNAAHARERIATPNRVRVSALPLESKSPNGHYAGPIRIPPRRTIGIRCSSVFLRAIRTGRYRHPTGNANVMVTRRFKDRSCSAEDQATKQAEEENRNQQAAEPKGTTAQRIDETAFPGLGPWRISYPARSTVYVLHFQKTTSLCFVVFAFRRCHLRCARTRRSTLRCELG